MSVQSEIDRINNNVANTYSVLEQAGADMPQSRSTNNLAETAASIKAVLYDRNQPLTEDQKAQARQNIGAPGKAFYVTVTDNSDGTYTADKEFGEVAQAHANGCAVFCTIFMDGIPILLPLTALSDEAGMAFFAGLVLGLSFSVSMSADGVEFSFNEILSSDTMPTHLPSPGALDIRDSDGNFFGIYDGSENVKITLPGSVMEEVYRNEITENLNDEVYEYGYISQTGENYDALSPISTTFRGKNYIPVEGGRRLCFNWISQTVSSAKTVYVVQYNADKVCIVNRTEVQTEVNKWTNNGITLHADTRFVRLTWYVHVADLSGVKVNAFYYEDRAKMWTGAGDTVNYVPHFLSEKVGDYIPLKKVQSSLTGKKIIYDGDSIAESRLSYANNGGGYAKLIADLVGGEYENHAVGGARLTTAVDGATYHSVVDNLPNLPFDGDLYCFEGGINDYWTPKTLGTFNKTDFTGTLDTNTICGALETIFRYALSNFVGKPICFIIVHKIQSTAYAANANGDTFEDYRNAMVGICNKYSIPYYDAFTESGLNGWNAAQSNAYLTSNTNGTGDGIHPNAEGYKRYYVPQLISLFERITPVE